jgi:hypothetical protein
MNEVLKKYNFKYQKCKYVKICKYQMISMVVLVNINKCL